MPNLKIHELVTRQGFDIHRVKEIHQGGISGVFECIYSESDMFEVGELENNLISRYTKITTAQISVLFAAITGSSNMNDPHINTLHEVLVPAVVSKVDIKAGVIIELKTHLKEVPALAAWCKTNSMVNGYMIEPFEGWGEREQSRDK